MTTLLSNYTKEVNIPQIRQDVFSALSGYMDISAQEAAHKCVMRLLSILPHRPLQNNVVFVAYGGGKDSSYMVAFVRFLQLLIFREHQGTFHLRVATNRHSGMPVAVMENIDRVYRALEMYEDPDVELLLIDGNEVNYFDVTSPIPATVIERNRLDILMTGHRCRGEARPTFCNACNLSMANSFGVALSHDRFVDIVITGDSTKEQRAYFAWIRRIGAKFGLAVKQEKTDFGGLLRLMDDIAQHYFTDIYGAEATEAVQAHRINITGTSANPVFFSIYQDTGYEAGSHWELLTEFLNFQFDDIAFSFTESDCANPSLMAHFRGLKAEHVFGKSYQDGIVEYAHFALDLMQKKGFPAQLIQIMQERYQSTTSIAYMRYKLTMYAYEVLDLSEEQIVCLLSAPFVQQGQGLEAYLKKEQPDYLPYLANMHKLLAGLADQPLTTEQQLLALHLRSCSHLSLGQLRTLYQARLSENDIQQQKTPIEVILAKDPHKAYIETSHSPAGEVVVELISGR